MKSRNFGWITLATAVLATLAAASGLALQPPPPWAAVVAAPGACPVMAPWAGATQRTTESNT
jgi:hypothetical protein